MAEAGSNVPKKVVKFLNGKKVVKRTCGNGYKYNPKTKRCEKLSPSEIKTLHFASKKRVRKMKTKMASILRKRMRSIGIRNSRMGS